MLAKVAVLCVCFLLVSAKSAGKAKVTREAQLQLESCDTGAILSNLEKISLQTAVLARSVSTEVAKVAVYFHMCSNPLDIAACLLKGIKGIVSNVAQIVGQVKSYMSDLSVEVPTLVADIHTCFNKTSVYH